MENKPSFNGIGSSKKITLRTTPNKPEIKNKKLPFQHNVQQQQFLHQEDMLNFF